jgi:2'-5' RNA ligase
MRMYQAKLYVMIKATPESLGHLRACRSWHALDEHYPSKTFHSTLLKLGLASAWPPEKLGLLIEALGAVRFDPFEVLFDEIDGTLLRGGAGSSEAKAFHQALRRAALPCGVELPLHNFWLHHSLAYKDEGRREPGSIRLAGASRNSCSCAAIMATNCSGAGRWSGANTP